MARPTRGIFQAPGDLIAGAIYPVRALAVINRTPSLWRYVIIPVLVNIVVGALLYAGLLVAGLQAIDVFMASLPAWASALDIVLRVLLRVVLVIGLLVTLGYLLVRFGVVLGSPWYSQLSERLERICTGQPPPTAPASALGFARDIWRALLFEGKKLLLLIGIGLPLLLLNLVPLIGPLLAIAGGTALGATIACLDFFDPPLERRRLRFRAKLRLIRHSLLASAGFGLVCFGLVSIPLVNLLSIPLCITAGTLFFCDHLRADQLAGRSQ